MIPDQTSEKSREKSILHAVMAIEHMVRALPRNNEAPALAFNSAAFQMSGATEAITSARNVAQEYHVDMSELPADKSAYPDYRKRMLAKLEVATEHLKLTQQCLRHDTEDENLSLFFRRVVKECDTAISNATKLIQRTVMEGNALIQSQQSQQQIISAIRQHRPKPAPKPGWMTLVVSNP